MSVQLAYESVEVLSLFNGLETEDISKAEWLLSVHPEMNYIIKNVDFVIEQEAGEGISSFQSMSDRNGALRAEASGTAIIRDRRDIAYLVYVHLTKAIRGAISSILDPYELIVVDLLFVQGLKYTKEPDYTFGGSCNDSYPLPQTTFYDKRRRALKRITNILKINGTLDFVACVYGAGSEKAEYALAMPERYRIQA